MSFDDGGWRYCFRIDDLFVSEDDWGTRRSRKAMLRYFKKWKKRYAMYEARMLQGHVLLLAYVTRSMCCRWGRILVFKAFCQELGPNLCVLCISSWKTDVNQTFKVILVLQTKRKDDKNYTAGSAAGFALNHVEEERNIWTSRGRNIARVAGAHLKPSGHVPNLQQSNGLDALFKSTRQHIY